MKTVRYTLFHITITKPNKRKKKFGKTSETMEGFCFVIFITGLLTGLLLEKVMMTKNKCQISTMGVT
jgi:hypothetical protein